MHTVSPSPLLKTALRADAVVSGVAAVVQLAAASWLSERLALPRPLLFETGAFLVAYTTLLVVMARSAAVWSTLVRIVVAGNVAWAIGCIALAITGAVSPSGLGVAFLGAQALGVLVFAVLEHRGLGTSRPLNDARVMSAA